MVASKRQLDQYIAGEQMPGYGERQEWLKLDLFFKRASTHISDRMVCFVWLYSVWVCASLCNSIDNEVRCITKKLLKSIGRKPRLWQPTLNIYNVNHILITCLVSESCTKIITFVHLVWMDSWKSNFQAAHHSSQITSSFIALPQLTLRESHGPVIANCNRKEVGRYPLQ